MSDIEMYSVLTSGLREVVIRKFLIIVSARCTLVTEGGEESDQLTRLIRMFRSWKYCQRVKLNGMVHHTAQKKKKPPRIPRTHDDSRRVLCQATERNGECK